MLDDEHCLIAMKDKMINVEDAAKVFELLAAEKCRIDSGRREILTAIARQIIAHRKVGCRDVPITQEVKRWALVLHTFFFVENSRSIHREVSAKSIETKIFEFISELDK